MDETSLTTVQTPKKVLSGKESRHFNRVVSAERGTLAMQCCIVNVSDVHLPPALIFLWKIFKSYIINNAPVGTLDLTNLQAG